MRSIRSSSYLTIAILHTVQLKGNLTHTGTAHATYWLKAHGFINLYWCVREEKPAKI